MKLKYDAKADRMRLVIDRDNQPARVFWLKRNQCLALLARFSDLAERFNVDPTAMPPPDPPSQVPATDATIDAVEPVDLDTIRVRAEGEKIRLALVHPQEGMAMTMSVAGMMRLQETLMTQAERVGWDPVAGGQRLRALAEARAAINRSKDSDS